MILFCDGICFVVFIIVSSFVRFVYIIEFIRRLIFRRVIVVYWLFENSVVTFIRIVRMCKIMSVILELGVLSLWSTFV